MQGSVNFMPVFFEARVFESARDNPSNTFNPQIAEPEIEGMNASHICLACRRRLSQIRPEKTSQWHPKATFISLSTNPRTTTGEKAKDDLLKLGDEAEGRKGRQTGAIPERKRRVPLRPSKNPGDVLESLFEQSLRPPTPAADVLSKSITSLEPYKHADTLRKMLSDGDSIADSWYFFVEHFGPGARREPVDQKLPAFVHTTVKELLKEITHAKSRDPLSQTLPSVTEVSRICMQLGLLHGSEWGDLVFILLENILRIKEQPTEDNSGAEGLLLDLLGAWNIVCRPIGTHNNLSAPDSISLDWSQIPAISTRDVVQVGRKHGPQLSFGLLVPPFPSRHVSSIPVIAAATFDLFTEDSVADTAVLAEAGPLTSLLGRVIGASGLDFSQVSASNLGSAAAFVIESVVNNWPQTKKRASAMRHVPVEPVNVPQPLCPSVRMNISFINKRLHDALGRRDACQVDTLWADVVHWPTSKQQSVSGQEGVKQGTLSEELCNYFILVYMGLRQPNRAIDVWNHMVKSGLPPNLATWDSMLSGCKASRDWKALDEVWLKMQDSGVKPDVVCWTSRISGLVESNRIDSAIRALDEMGRLWLAAAKAKHGNMKLEELQKVEDVEGAVKPTIVTINAAVAGLLRKKRSEAAHRVLAWAGKFGISPDVITYNTLLRPLVREGHSQEAMNLLRQMQASGIQADVATFTTILDETFRYSDRHTPEEQKDIIESVFSEMEAAGVKANLHTYGKTIYQLLQAPNADLTVVNAVMERMAKQGMQPSTYIYTILVEYYFDQQPPDLDAVRSLIDHTRLEVGSTDHKFWDRVIEGYARAGETASAVRILGKINSGHNKVGWLTLTELLSALAENEEWDVAKSLVRNAVVDSGGPLPEDVRGQEGQHRFWRLARELQLLEGL